MRALTDLAVAWRGGRRATRASRERRVEGSGCRQRWRRGGGGAFALALARLHLLILHLGLGGEVYLGVGGEVKRRRL